MSRRRSLYIAILLALGALIEFIELVRYGFRDRDIIALLAFIVTLVCCIILLLRAFRP